MKKQFFPKAREFFKKWWLPSIAAILLAIGFGTFGILKAAGTTTTIGANISTTGTLTVSGQVNASSTSLFTGAVTTYGDATFGDASSDVNLFTGRLQATSTALFTATSTFYSDVNLGDAVSDTAILKGRVSTGSIAGTALALNSGYTYPQLWEIRGTISDWSGFNDHFTGAYFRYASEADSASSGTKNLKGMEVNISSTNSTGALQGLYVETQYKTIAATETIGILQGIESNLSLYSQTQTANLTTWGTPFYGTIGIASGYSAGDLAKLHGMIIETRDDRGGSTASTLGYGLYFANKGEGVQTWTKGIYMNMAAVTGIDLAGAMTTEIALQNDETIDNRNNGYISLMGIASTTSIYFGTNGETITNATDGTIQLLGIASTTSITLLNGETISNATNGTITLANSESNTIALTPATGAVTPSAGSLILTSANLLIPANYGLDVAAAGTLNIGTSTANAITIGKSGVITSVLSPVYASSTLLVTGASTFYGNVTLGDAAADLIQINGGLYASSTFVLTGTSTLYSQTQSTITEGSAAAEDTRYNNFTVNSSADPVAPVSGGGVSTLYGAYNWTGSTGVFTVNGIEGVARSYAADEAGTFRGGYFRTYTSGGTMRTAVALEASARTAADTTAEAGTAFIGERIYMAPYFTAGTLKNLTNFYGLWIYGEHATQNNASSSIRVKDAGGGWDYGLDFGTDPVSSQYAKFDVADIRLSEDETISNVTDGSFIFADNSGNTVTLTPASGAVTPSAGNLILSTTEKFSIGSTTPAARLSITGAAGGTTPLLMISTSTNAYATTTVFSVDSNGLVKFAGNGIGDYLKWTPMTNKLEGVGSTTLQIGETGGVDNASGATMIKGYFKGITTAIAGTAIGVEGQARQSSIDSPSGILQGGFFKAGNGPMSTSGGGNLGTMTGVYAEVVGSHTTGDAAKTVTNARALELNLDLNQVDTTVTNAYGIYMKWNTDGSAVTNGYGLWIDNEGVGGEGGGGTGQVLDSAIYISDTSLSPGWEYGIDMSNAGMSTADVRLSNSRNIYSGSATTRAGVRAAVGDTAPVGSVYIGNAAGATTKPNMYIKVLNASADTDWERIVTQAAD